MNALVKFKNFISSFFATSKTVRVLKNRLYEEMKISKELEKELISLKNDFEFLKTKVEQSEHSEHQNTIKLWIREMINDFSERPYKNKLHGNWGYATELGDVNWKYKFDTGETWKLTGNINISGTTTITMNDTKTEVIVSISDETFKNVIELVKNFANEAESEDLSKFDKFKLSQEIDKALEQRDFKKVDDLRKELEKR